MLYASIMISSDILLDMLVYWDGLVFIYTNIHMHILSTKNLAFVTETSQEQK